MTVSHLKQLSAGCVVKGQGPVVVFQHGFLSGSDYWQKQIDALSDQFTVVATNLPGFGHNADKPSVDSITGYVDAIIADLDELGVKTFSFIGHSMGGMIAQEMALQHPDRVEKLILYCTGSVGELPGRFESIDESREKILANGLEATLQRTVSSWFMKGVNDPCYEEAIAMAYLPRLDAVLAGLTAMQNWQAIERLSQITCDTMVLWADKDRSYPWSQPETLWGAISNANLCVLSNAAHNMHLEIPDLFNQVVRRHLG